MLSSCQSMETYLLVANVAVFIGIMCVVLLLDKRRRSDIEQFSQTSQVLNESLAVLQGIHGSSSAKLTELKDAINQLQASIEGASRSGQSASENQNSALRDELHKSLDKISGTVEAAIKAHGKSQVEALGANLDTELEASRESSQELRDELEKIRGRLEALKTSLEESIKF
jgi:uncharacterized protein YlxW (UPF0749 family)